MNDKHQDHLGTEVQDNSLAKTLTPINKLTMPKISSIPLWASEAVGKISEFLMGRPKAKILEFGSGGSTIWLSNYDVEIISIEHDQRWFSALESEVKDQAISNVRLLLREKPYFKIADEFPDHHFDLILVDGRDRNECIQASLKKVKNGGLLVLDDAQRTRYRMGRNLLEAFPSARYYHPHRYTQIWSIRHDLNYRNLAVDNPFENTSNARVPQVQTQGILENPKQTVTQTRVTQIVSNNKPLAAIICGYEQGGTTLVNQILKQHPQLDSGFECGFLLVENIPDFLGCEPYHEMLRAGWGLVEAEVKYICSAESWPQAYQRLLDKSRLIKNKDVFLFDKTPRYMLHLSNVLKKVTDIPCIVIVRDPRAVLSSWTKRRGEKPEILVPNFCKHYLSYGRGWKFAIENGYSDRILLVQYENLCSNPHKEAEKIFNFLGFDFDPSYLHFDTSEKFRNVYDTTISDQHLTEYEKSLDEEICKSILLETEEFKGWHWHPERK